MHICCFLLINIIQLTNQYRQFVGQVMTDMFSIKEIVKRATLSKGMKKCSFYFYCFSVDILIRNEDIISEGRKTKNCLK